MKLRELINLLRQYEELEDKISNASFGILPPVRERWEKELEELGETEIGCVPKEVSDEHP